MKRKTRKWLFAGLYFLLALVTYPFRVSAAEGDFPSPPSPPRLVNDLAHTMNDGEIAALENKLVAFADSTSNQIAIVTVRNIGDYEISDYTLELFNRWQIGTKEHKNGVLILAAMENRKMWITTGYGLEGALPDGLVGQIIRQEMVPAFKKGAYYEGFDKAADAVMKATRGEYKAKEGRKKSDKVSKPVSGIGILIIVLIIIFLVRRGGGGGRGGGGYLGPGGWIAANIIGNAIGRSFGGGGDWGGRSGGGGGGGFGGFGGGSSGGGGAGGSW